MRNMHKYLFEYPAKHLTGNITGYSHAVAACNCQVSADKWSYSTGWQLMTLIIIG